MHAAEAMRPRSSWVSPQLCESLVVGMLSAMASVPSEPLAFQVNAPVSLAQFTVNWYCALRPVPLS